MKNLSLIIIILFTTSCYSYQNTTDNKSFDIGKTYKITNNNGVKTKLNITEIKNDTIMGLNKNQKIDIPISEITKYQKRKFSWGKTIGLSVGGSLVAVTIAFIVALSNLGTW